MPNKPTTKKTNNKTGLKRRFDLTNKKVQFFVVIAIVAVLGGGYLTVKSFANTILFTWDGNSLLTGQVEWQRVTTGSSICPGQRGTEPGKNNAVTFDISCPMGPAAFATGSILRVSNHAPGFYEACVSVKGAGIVSIGVREEPVTSGVPAASRQVTSNNNGSYNRYCSGSFYATRGTAGGGALIAELRVKRDVNQAVLMKVQNVQISKLASQTPTPTAPAPAK